MKMFKKSLVGAAVFGLASTTYAATIVPTSVEAPSPQAISTADTTASDTFVFTTAADYGTGDTIQFTFSQAPDSTHSFSTTTLVGAGCTVGAAEIAFAGASGSVATYIFGTVPGSTINCAFTIPAVDFDGSAVAAADTVSVSAATSRGYGTLESVAATDLIDVTDDQFGLTITGADGIVDVEEDRQEWTTATSDTIVVELTDDGGGATLAATSVVTISGDNTWAKAVALDGTVTWPGIASSGPALTISDNSLSYTQAAAAATTITYNAAAVGLDADFMLPNQSFTVSATVDFTDADAVAQQESLGGVAGNGGAWTLNGASITAYGISNSPTVTPMIWVQNGGLSNGNITATVFCDDNVISVSDLGTASARSNTKVGEAIQAAVDADGSCPTSNTRYDATVTVNAPADDITINASYKVTAADGATDRVMLETSDSLPAISDAAN